MAAGKLKVLCIHGVGHGDTDTTWGPLWQEAVSDGLERWNPELEVEYHFTRYDDLFASTKISPAVLAEAVFRLTGSAALYGAGDLVHRRRGFGELKENLRWTAGMVAQWSADEKLRAATRERIRQDVEHFKPDVVLAHSLGSLLAYDLFARKGELLKNRYFVSFGSQIGNPAVRATFGGRIQPLPHATKWYHLYNRHDDVLTAPLKIAADNFRQVQADFDIEGFMDHAGECYLGHENTANTVWQVIAQPQTAVRALARSVSGAARVQRARKRRALLVGINAYPDPASRLDGCVNDVFRMSEVLQELGFDAGDIRVVLDERATAEGIRERLEWLVDDAGAGDERVFFYSGHGAQIPAYDQAGEVDASDECLVAWDFDWTRERAVTDDWFAELYSQLPYDAHFISVFDCCHSGGMARNGLPKSRGLTAPDDIRHRALRWDAGREMWVPRVLKLAEQKLVSDKAMRSRWLGRDGQTRKLGAGTGLWTEQARYDEARAAYGHRGPYAPLLIQACREDEFAYEYRHGVTSFGAFTFSFSTLLRQLRREGVAPSFQELVALAGERLAELQYNQHPQILGPRDKLAAKVPFILPAASGGAKPAKAAKPKGKGKAG